MNLLKECAIAFEKMLNIKYNIIIGRKNTSLSICIGFSKSDFHHLIGLHKLVDYDYITTGNRSRIFDDIINGRIGYSDISNNNTFGMIKDRLEPFSSIESLLDSNQLIFKYNNHTNRFSVIQAEYLLSTPYQGNDIYIFLDKDTSTNQYFCRSFFPKDKKDYTIGQTSYTLLYKEKVNTVTGKVELQYNKLYDYRMVSLKEAEILKDSGLPFVMKKADENRGIIRFEKRNAAKVDALIGASSQMELRPNQNNRKR